MVDIICQRRMFSEKALKNKDKFVESGERSPQRSERYTIFHALFEVLKEKDHKKRKKK
jgi:hypothetical protein